MLISTSELFTSTVAASGQLAGMISDFYFDDQWQIRYLLVLHSASGGAGQLISPLVLSQPQVIGTSFGFAAREAHWPGQKISPNGAGIWQNTEWPGCCKEHLQQTVTPAAASDAGWGTPGDSSIRSAKEVLRYHTQAPTPHNKIEDFIAETESWTVQYMVLGLNSWLPQRTIWVRPNWIDRADYDAWLYDYYCRPKEPRRNSLTTGEQP